jgi:hypothetical protein
MARRRKRGRIPLMLLVLLIGVAGGAGIGIWLDDRARSGPANSETAVPLEAVPQALVPIQPDRVQRLSLVPAADAPHLLAHLFAWSGAPEPSSQQALGLAALTQCPALRRVGPSGQDPLIAAARTALQSPPTRRARIAVSLPLPAQPDGGSLTLPALSEPLRLRVIATPPPACAGIYSVSGQPSTFDILISGPAPWPPSYAIQGAATLGGALFADLVVDLGETASMEASGSVMIAAQPISLYLWTDETRRTPLGGLGLAAPDSQDAPPPVTSEPEIDQTPLGGKPVSAEIARRAAQTGAVPLPPISTAPRPSVETRPLPPALPTR